MADGPEKEKTSDRARYDFKRKLEELRNIRGSATQLISLYIPPGRQIHEVMSQLRSEYSQAQNIKSKATMKNVTSALESAMSRLKTFKDPGEHGIVIFVGARSIGGDQTKMVSHVIIPPLPITLMKYHCDSSFFLEPLEGMLKEHNNYGLVVVDRQESTIGFLRGQAVQVVTNMQSMVPNKHAKGGQSARRFERITEEVAERWFQKIGEVANEIFMPELEKGDLKGVLVGGPGPTKEYWLEGKFMNHELHKRIIGQPIDTGYTDEYGLRDLVSNAGPILRDFGLMEEKDLINRFMREIGKPDGGLAAYGEEHVRHTLTIGAVDTLILSERLRKKRLNMKCESCGWEKEETTDMETLEFEKRYDACPQCNQHAVAVDTEVDIVDELSEMAESMAAKVKIIAGGSDEGELFYKAFGGMGAILRFRVD